MPQIALVIAGIGAAGWAFGRLGEALDSGSNVTKWAVIGGGLYLAYRGSQSAGLIK